MSLDFLLVNSMRRHSPWDYLEFMLALFCIILAIVTVVVAAREWH